MDRRDEAGFTLIELMVVVLVVSILLLISLPTFVGARSRAADASARISAQIAADAALSVAATDFTTMDATWMAVEEPSLTYVASPLLSTGPKVVSVAPSATGWAAAVLSTSGSCFSVLVNSAGATLGKIGTGLACSGASTLSGASSIPIAGAAAWFDATVSASLVTSAGVVTSWLDQSGNGRDLTSGANSTYAVPVGLQLGGGYSGTNERSAAAISEVLIYHRALSDTERTQTEAYLAAKWGTPNNSPSSAVRASSPDVWLDASDPSTLVQSGATVTAWNDKSGNARNFTLSGAGVTWSGTGLNNLPAIVTDGTGVLSNSTIGSGVTSMTIFVVARQTGALNRRIVSGISNNWLLGWWNGGMDQVYFERWITAGNSQPTTTTAAIEYTATLGVQPRPAVWKNGQMLVSSFGSWTVDPTGLNGHPAVRSDGTAILSVASLGSVTDGTTAFVVARQIGSSNQRIVSGLSNNWLLGWWNGRENQAYFGGWLSSPGTAATTGATMYSATTGNGQASAWRNGLLLASQSGGFTNPSGLQVGGGYFGSEFSTAAVGEVMVYNRILTVPERQSVEAYLATKWGIVLGT